MQVTATSVVTAQHGANDPPILFSNETESRVAAQKCGNGGARVGLVQPHAFGTAPQGDHRIEILDSEKAHARSPRISIHDNSSSRQSEPGLEPTIPIKTGNKIHSAFVIPLTSTN